MFFRPLSLLTEHIQGTIQMSNYVILAYPTTPPQHQSWHRYQQLKPPNFRMIYLKDSLNRPNGLNYELRLYRKRAIAYGHM